MTSTEPRDIAIGKLYEIDTRPEEIDLEDLPARAARMVRGVTEQRESLDNRIESASEHWSVSRMPVVDRAILRLALWELDNEPGTPTAVIVSEAVRLAETYSTARSSSFVNGVLSALAKKVRTG